MIKLGKLFIIYCLKPVTNSVAFLLLASKLASGGTEASVWPPMILRNKSGGHLILSEEYAVLPPFFETKNQGRKNNSCRLLFSFVLLFLNNRFYILCTVLGRLSGIKREPYQVELQYTHSYMSVIHYTVCR